MQIRFSCTTENCPALIEFEPLDACDGRIECPRCRTAHVIAVDETVRGNGPLARCPRCGGEEFFIRKDFPQGLGLLIVAVAAVISCIYLKELGFFTLAILGAAALIDAILYWVIGKVTVCYRCRSEYRKLAMNPGHASFDLATAEKYA